MDIRELRSVDPEEDGYVTVYFLNGPYAGTPYWAYVEQGREVIELEVGSSIDHEQFVFRLYNIDTHTNEHTYVLGG